MQDMTSTICDNVTPSAYGEQVTLIDKRDNKTYTVSKLKDNHCWMTQNLALELSTTKTIKNTDTDLNSVTSFTPERNTIASGNLSTTTWAKSNTDPYSYNSGRTDYGVYYNWTAVIASNDSSSLTTQYQNAPNSICPKGWRLPMVYNGSEPNSPNEFGVLLNKYDYIADITISPQSWINSGYIKIRDLPLNFVLSGRINDDSNALGNMTSVYFWSSTIGSSAVAYDLAIGGSGAYFQVSHGRSHGFPTRCLAR